MIAVNYSLLRTVVVLLMSHLDAYRTMSSERVLPLELLLNFVVIYAQTFLQW